MGGGQEEEPSLRELEEMKEGLDCLGVFTSVNGALRGVASDSERTRDSFKPHNKRLFNI